MNRKIIIGGAIGVFVIVVVAVVVVITSLDHIIKVAVEKYGSEMTKAKVDLASVDLSASSGTGTLKGFAIGNPAGFNSPRAMSLGEVTVQVQPRSITTDTIVIDRIVIRAPEITYEMASDGSSNLQALQKNIEAYTGGSKAGQPAKPDEPGKKLIIKDLLITDAKIGVSAPFLSGQALGTPLPQIHLTDIGREGKAAAPAEVAERVMSAVTLSATKAVSALNIDQLKNLGSAGAKEIEQQVKGAADKAGGLIDNFRGSLGGGTK